MNELSLAIDESVKMCIENGTGLVELDNVTIYTYWEVDDNKDDVICVYISKDGIKVFEYTVRNF